MKFGLSANTITKIQDVFAKCPQIDYAILYGSRAKGTYKTGSDIDLTLQGLALDMKLLSKVSNDIDDLMLPYKFDLSIFNDISNKELLEHIKRMGIGFYKKTNTH
jgi:predicted nucleotidyltransferase